MYETDFHSDKSLDLRHPRYQDLIGCDRTGLYLLPQSNKYGPEMSIFEIGKNARVGHRIAVTGILKWMSGFKGGKGIVDPFNLPPYDYDWNISIGEYHNTTVGLNFTLKVDPFGKFKAV